ncbi:hypothetical protein BDV93DRAFT_516431 [Ceratobasidium sp. AG-I]|nr:hypothetical protein BDV93DRAFT_516431 [Ceratobasidium sp. AG-I]
MDPQQAGKFNEHNIDLPPTLSAVTSPNFSGAQQATSKEATSPPRKRARVLCERNSSDVVMAEENPATEIIQVTASSSPSPIPSMPKPLTTTKHMPAQCIPKPMPQCLPKPAPKLQPKVSSSNTTVLHTRALSSMTTPSSLATTSSTALPSLPKTCVVAYSNWMKYWRQVIDKVVYKSGSEFIFEESAIGKPVYLGGMWLATTSSAADKKAFNVKKKKHTPKPDKYGNLPPKVPPAAVGPSTTGNPPVPRAYHLNASIPAFFDPGYSGNLGALQKEILKRTGGMLEGLESLREETAKSADIILQRGSPFTQKHYENTKQSYEICLSILSHTAIKDPWVCNIMLKYAPSYLDFCVLVTLGHKGNKNVYNPTSGQKCGGMLLFCKGLCDKLDERVFSLITTHKLNRHTSTRGRSFGCTEVQMCIEHTLSASCQCGCLVRIQEICALVIGVSCGVRPSGLAAAHPEYVEQGKYFKTGDIKIYG